MILVFTGGKVPGKSKAEIMRDFYVAFTTSVLQELLWQIRTRVLLRVSIRSRRSAVALLPAIAALECKLLTNT